ncbi:MAG: right-handed parallel beta-helix repeat-containing protein [Solirubrobacteraceae bacterium]
MLVLTLAVGLLTPAVAGAHVERPAYWPTPAADDARDRTDVVADEVGGRVPKARSLGTALDRGRAGATHVVCQPDSLTRLQASIDEARTDGYRLRPSQPLLTLSEKEADDLLAINRKLFRRCRNRSIQAAVNVSGNHDRVVILPGVYTEPKSRAEPTFDKRCEHLLQDTDFGGGGPIGLSYRYQTKCPNDQNLIAVLGRAAVGGHDPKPGVERHGIPNIGECIRCGMQIEGTGVKAEDVVIDAGDVHAGFGGPSAAGHAKDVGLRIDRADGTVLRNFSVRHAREHGIYIIETDGYYNERTKYFYNGEYGLLTFASDHGLTEECEGLGSGDSAVYPGGAPDTGAQTVEPTRRHNQEMRLCDLHHNTAGYSGTMGNATRLAHNEIYDNALGISTDSFFAGGHPGYPQDSSAFQNNRIYDNNFNPYAPGSDVKPIIPVPVGSGLQIAGGNENVVSGNHIFDNWRDGARLLAVPDLVSCPPGEPTCVTSGLVASTSNGNRFHDNVMGTAPDGAHKPNGTDFWWDQFPLNQGNCWYDNGAFTSDPAPNPIRGGSMPGFLPEDCAASVGTGNVGKEATLLYCAFAPAGDPGCPWFTSPSRPAGAEGFARRADGAASTGDGGTGGEHRASGAARTRGGTATSPRDASPTASAAQRAWRPDCGDGGRLWRATDPARACRTLPDVARDVPRGGTQALQAIDCSAWRAAGAERRLGILHYLRAAATEPNPETPGPTLTDGEGLAVMERVSSGPVADRFLLYGIYNRAAAYQRGRVVD